MKTIIAINKKFMSISPIELHNLIMQNSNSIDGYEIYIDYTNEKEVEYLEKLVQICYQEKKYLQIHGNSSLPLEKQIEYIKYLEKISDYLGYKIHIVLHSINASTIKESIDLTTRYLDSLTKVMDDSKIIISLENINDITPIVANNEKIYLTYDIGHELVDYSNPTTINSHIVPLISNVHIHTFNSTYSEGYDHKPILKNDEHWNEIIKSILFLKRNQYDKSIVFEYDLYTCPGNDNKEKIIFYCKSIDFVSERVKG